MLIRIFNFNFGFIKIYFKKLISYKRQQKIKLR